MPVKFAQGSHSPRICNKKDKLRAFGPNNERNRQNLLEDNAESIGISAHAFVLHYTWMIKTLE